MDWSKEGARTVFAILAVTLLLLSGCTRVLESEGIYGPVPETEDEAAGEGAAADEAEPGEAGVEVSEETDDLQPRFELFTGTGGVVGRPRKSVALVTEESGGDITLDFVDADIREVLKATLTGVLGLNYTVAPEINAAITVQTGRPISRSSLLPTLENILRLHGIAIVREGNIYRIAALQGAAHGNRAMQLGMARSAAGDGYGIQIVPLNYVGAAEMAKTLQPLARKESVLHVDETRNLLVLGGTQYERAAMLEAVEIFDVNWLAGMSFGLFKLEFAEADALSDEISSLLGDGKGNLLEGLVRLVPIDRLNAILAVSRQPRYLNEVRRWVERLDVAGRNGTNRQLFIYFVQNGTASDLAEVLSAVFSDEQRATEGKEVRAGDIAPNLEPVEIRGAPQQQPEGQQQAESQPAPTRTAPATPASRSDRNDRDGISLARAGGPRIVADDERNALLISGTGPEYRAVLNALKELDRRPLEVLIEVTIADVTLSDTLRYGIRWFFQTDSGRHSVTQTDLNTDTGLLGGVGNSYPGLGYAYTATNVAATLDLLSSLTDVKVISAPQLMVLNNQQAQLQVGEQVPIATTQATSVPANETDTPVVRTSVELKDVGVILKVTPRVNNSGLVLLEIEQEVSTANLDAGAGPLTPVINKRIITTSAAVQSGQTVALGGLIQETKDNLKIGVPGLSAIPFFGALFRYTTDTVSRNELLVMVTPTVIRDEREALETTEELRERMEDLERLEQKIR